MLGQGSEHCCGASIYLHWRPLEKSAQCPELKPPQDIQQCAGRAGHHGELLHAMYPLARNKWLQAGYRGALWTRSKRSKPPSVIKKDVLLGADSRTKSVWVKHLLQSSFQVTLKSMPKRAHLDIHILLVSGECPKRNGFSEYVWAAEGLSVLCPALKAQHFTIQEVQIAVSFFYFFLKSSVLLEAQAGGQSSSLGHTSLPLSLTGLMRLCLYLS